MEALRYLLWIPAFAGMAVLFTPSPVFAQEEAAQAEKPAAEEAQAKTKANELPSAYSPEHCEFSVAFPEEPASKEICEEDPVHRCQQQINFTKVYDMASTVNFRVICSAIDEEIYKNYSAEIMEKTLLAMTNQNVVKAFDTSFREADGFKQAGLVGEGTAGQMSTLYIAQLWIGKKSAMSLEAEMIGEKNDEAEQLFSDILKSAHYAGDKTKAKSEEESKDEKAAKKKKKKKEEPKEEEPEKEPSE